MKNKTVVKSTRTKSKKPTKVESLKLQILEARLQKVQTQPRTSGLVELGKIVLAIPMIIIVFGGLLAHYLEVQREKDWDKIGDYGITRPEFIPKDYHGIMPKP